MEFSRRIIVVLVIAAMATITILPCSAVEKDEKDIWTEEERRGPGPGPGPGPGRPPGPGRGPGRGPRRFELTDEEIDRIMKGLQESNPAKAKELAKLRETDPNEFSTELRKHVREQFEKLIEFWRSRRREEFLKWLGKAVPSRARELTKLKDTKPDLYAKKYELTWRKYGRIFEEGRRNPELAEVLMADLKLEERQELLCSKIKAATNEKEKKQLMSQLEEVVSDKYDLLLRRKRIAYERLLRRLEELQKRLRESRNEISKWKDEKIKAQNVKERIKHLTEETRRFRWR